MKRMRWILAGLLATFAAGTLHAAPFFSDLYDAGSFQSTLSSNKDSLFFSHGYIGSGFAPDSLERGTIVLRFSGSGNTWTRGRFDLLLGDSSKPLAESLRFGDSVEVDIGPDWLSKLVLADLAFKIVRSNGAGSATFHGSQLSLWGTETAVTQPNPHSDAAPVPTPGTVPLMAAGLLAGLAFRRATRA